MSPNLPWVAAIATMMTPRGLMKLMEGALVHLKGNAFLAKLMTFQGLSSLQAFDNAAEVGNAHNL